MPLQLLREMLRTPVLDILHHVKRSGGMTVGELGEEMKMSYMGVKQHCDDLVRKGMLDTVRRAKRSGRPERLYRITTRLDPLFAGDGMALALDFLAAAQQVYGETAPSKILCTYFQAKADVYAAKLSVCRTLPARARALAELRTAEGCISAFEQDKESGALRLVEHHHPLRELSSEHEIVTELECELVERLLDCEVTRTSEEISGLVRIVFNLTPR